MFIPVEREARKWGGSRIPTWTHHRRHWRMWYAKVSMAAHSPHRAWSPRTALLGAIVLSLLAAHCRSVDGEDAESSEAANTEEARANECADALEAIPPNAWHKKEGRVDPDAQPAVLNASRVCLSRY